jgi:sterol desaturase/sphingolipid hydroxylase (fatty acid hydroxylase superfamily)
MLFPKRFAVIPPPLRPRKYADVPPDQASPVWFGVAVHIGPVFLSWALFRALGSTLAASLLATLPVSFATLGVAEWAAHVRPAVALRPMTLEEFLVGSLWHVMGKGFVIGVCSLVVLWALLHRIAPVPAHPASSLRLLLGMMATDFWYFALHGFFMHGKGRALVERFVRREHVIHHAVTELDFWRGNVGSVLDNGFVSFPLPLALFSIPLGLDLASAIFVYMTLMTVQVTHHVNHSFDIGPLKLLVFDSHAHKMHHCGRGRLVNFAAMFAVWDRVFGTYYEDWSLSPSYMHAHGIALPLTESRPEPPMQGARAEAA